MSNRVVKFEFTSGENEQIEATIIMPKETRSVIHGVVKDCKNYIIKDAVVKLFEIVDHCGKHKLKPVGHTFTDECGQFLFGPLIPKVNYLIKVWVNDIKIKELVIKPDIDNFCYKDDDNFNNYTNRGYAKRDKRGSHTNKFKDEDYCNYENDEDF